MYRKRVEGNHAHWLELSDIQYFAQYFAQYLARVCCGKLREAQSIFKFLHANLEERDASVVPVVFC
jgi:hypothetical protein